jgi:Mlc titration factor MtfA (ptsG expression regulator)
VKFYRKLNEENRSIFRKRVGLFLDEIYIEGVETEVEELDKVLIVASAIIPVFGFDEWHYNVLTSVILYPKSFNEQLGYSNNENDKRISGMVGTGRFQKQMILSKAALRKGFFNITDKRNTAIHEFVHLMDKMDGETDGIPEGLLEKQFIIPWLKAMHDEMEDINNNKSDIRKYGGMKQTEFFAVASEYFFERPILMKKKHPDLYEMLVKCFNQVPMQNN